MKPPILEFRKSDDPRDVMHQACEHLADGRLVAFPTEALYVVAGAPLVDGVAANFAAAGLSPGAILGLRVPEELPDYVDPTPSLAGKLARRCWPGPVTMQFPGESAHGLFEALPRETQALLLAADNRLSLRVPAHEVLQGVLRLSPGPLLLSRETVLPGDPGLTSAAEVVRRHGHAIDLVIDDGPCRYGEATTSILFRDAGWEVTQQGVVTARTLGRLASEVYLFVCTGNTCRSPMAEAIFRRMLAERLNCSDDDLVDHGYIVASAGIAAPVGAPAAREAVDLLAEMRVELRNHESQPLTERLLNQADRVFTMTRGHRQAILAERPDLAGRIELLAGAEGDISDPIGAGREVYEACKDEIQRHLRRVVDEVAPPRSGNA
ncbi:Sua5/YciO/YrdC/YwlC family protein [Planctellipticum variicoloris]|uniref:arsenate reductase/protein-tyrosine-phosphatase family protein n=1 Tax=Planctellipticum variicoloris TaxID=3064265 RepID=UPI00301382DB|nr:Sua5/YciO/YrdC/YwlC family protein [Planctomycetaceae bacterium SH412]